MRHKIIANIPNYDGIGIYKITNVNNGKVYIGSSLHCMTRLKEHNRSLPNNAMEKDCGENAFVAEIIQAFPEGCTNKDLQRAEKYFLEEAKKAGAVYNSPFHTIEHNWNRGKTNDFVFPIFVEKGQKDIIKAHAESKGESLNGFINRAINETMKRDNKVE